MNYIVYYKKEEMSKRIARNQNLYVTNRYFATIEEAREFAVKVNATRIVNVKTGVTVK